MCHGKVNTAAKKKKLLKECKISCLLNLNSTFSVPGDNFFSFLLDSLLLHTVLSMTCPFTGSISSYDNK